MWKRTVIEGNKGREKGIMQNLITPIFLHFSFSYLPHFPSFPLLHLLLIAQGKKRREELGKEVRVEGRKEERKWIKKEGGGNGEGALKKEEWDD